MHFLIPKFLLKDPKMLSLRRITNYEIRPSDLCASLIYLLKQTEAKRQVFYVKICIKACLETEKTQTVCCGQPKNNYFMLNSNKISHCGQRPKNMGKKL